MLTRMMPARAVANCATTHSELFGDQIPTRSPRLEPEGDESRRKGVGPRAQLTVGPADALVPDHKRLGIGQTVGNPVQRGADCLAEQGLVARAVGVALGERHCRSACIYRCRARLSSRNLSRRIESRHAPPPLALRPARFRRRLFARAAAGWQRRAVGGRCGAGLERARRRTRPGHRHRHARRHDAAAALRQDLRHRRSATRTATSTSRACARAGSTRCSSRSGCRATSPAPPAVKRALQLIDAVHEAVADASERSGAGDDRRRHPPGRGRAQDRGADGHGRRPHDRRRSGQLREYARARRPLPDADALQEQQLGRLVHRQAGAQRPDRRSARTSCAS